ncbi:4045_t:CDS:2, partial [Funneliformis geosporum]
MVLQRQPKKHCLAINYDLKRQICIISKVLLQREKCKNILDTKSSNKAFKHKPVKFPELDYAMSIWVGNVSKSGIILTDLLIKEKLRVFVTSFGIQEGQMSFSNGSASLASLLEERMKLQQLQ